MMRRIPALTFLSGLLMLFFSFGMVLTQRASADPDLPLQARTPVWGTPTALALTQLALPTATPPVVTLPPLGEAPRRIYDDFYHLVIFRDSEGHLTFYHLADQGGGFHSWLYYPMWFSALPGQTILNHTDDWGYTITLTRLTDFQINSANLLSRQPPDTTGYWFQVTLTNPDGTRAVDDYLYLLTP